MDRLVSDLRGLCELHRSGGLTDGEFVRAKELLLKQTTVESFVNVATPPAVTKADDGSRDMGLATRAWVMAALTFLGLVALLLQQAERPTVLVLGALAAMVIFFFAGLRFWRLAERKRGSMLMAKYLPKATQSQSDVMPKRLRLVHLQQDSIH